jgi:hypothetical protein
MQAQVKSPTLIRFDAEGPFLPPIEKPTGMMMKMVYSMTRRQFERCLHR